MKLISLNTWGGLARKEKILGFFEKHKNDIDIFCLQEIWSAPYEHLEGTAMGPIELQNDKIMTYGLQDISKVLFGYTAYFRPHHLDNYGLLMLVRKNFKVLEEGEIFVYKEKGYVHEKNIGNHARNIQYVTVETEEGLLTIVNFHGLWNGSSGKRDTEDTLRQSYNIINFMKKILNPIVFCGDFNLRPDTESIKKFEDFGLKNLIKEYGITSTRTSLYPKPEKYADYTFVSEGINVKDFKILPDEVSDHFAMYLDFEL